MNRASGTYGTITKDLVFVLLKTQDSWKYLNLSKYINLQIQEVEGTINRIN